MARAILTARATPHICRRRIPPLRPRNRPTGNATAASFARMRSHRPPHTPATEPICAAGNAAQRPSQSRTLPSYGPTETNWTEALCAPPKTCLKNRRSSESQLAFYDASPPTRRRRTLWNPPQPLPQRAPFSSRTRRLAPVLRCITVPGPPPPYHPCCTC